MNHQAQAQDRIVKYATDRATLEGICDVQPIRGSGPGGQHRNKVETGVRVTHPPSGLVVEATARRERTRNLDDAFERLAERLAALNFVPKVRRATRPTAGGRRRRLEAKRRLGDKKRSRRGEE
jgi:protein subunit release factor A